MDPLLFRQIEFVDLATYRLQNSKRPKKLYLQLLIAFGFDIFAIQPNFLAGSVTFRLCFFIVGLFMQFLGILQVFSAYTHKIPKFLGQLISCFGLEARVDIFFIENV